MFGELFIKLEQMFSYGCWCQIRNQAVGGIVKGHGDPVDAMDGLCKAWHQCRACTNLDFGDECVSNDVVYEVGPNPEDANRIGCIFNPTECQVSTFNM